MHWECEEGCMSIPNCREGECFKEQDELERAARQAEKARYRIFWKQDAAIPPYLLKSVAMRGTCYPDSSEHTARSSDDALYRVLEGR